MLRKETEDVYGLYALEQHNIVAKAQLDLIFSKKITWSKSRRNNKRDDRCYKSDILINLV